MHSLVCVSIACASVCMSVPMYVCKCVYFGACVVGGWIKVWKVESAHHHDALNEERGLDPTLPQLPPVERSQPRNVAGFWVQREGKGMAANGFIVKARGMLNFDATSKMEPQ